ncbi:hypothetical protein Pmar_PMAR002288 [Perkinsus marinus ATCC 50983]|uniref:Uncharacterized protein n=1 Tax=Perkinsus marinus (strain ATCC 50983 / TXsc) TaxID=423536 RepID=C5KUX1_PERM5|nr:hypothetical protein Pmar_PMAR002288 [Perkinsus marinus ATCC 50983]EER11686.1 hypothetical protein Pmar_PMAR002288 [Perkinsus marinus ATCC 50983]|eukprot:XP_002779891.1 hypothetical protein Pmar_PMAR002288 [Perkinsus marinus ATCC 50983]
MAPPQKQYRTEEGGRWKCGVVYRAGTDTSDPLVSDAVRAYHALGERFAEAMQGDARPEERLELISQAARQAMKDPVVVAMFRSVEPASSPLPSIMPKQETDGLSERSWSRSRRRPSSHADSRTRPLSRSRSPHRFHGEYLMRNNPGLQRIQAEDPIAWDDEVDQSTPVPWDTVGQRTISSPVPPPPPPGRPRVSSHDNPFIPSPVHLPQRTEPRDPYFYTRRH